MKQLIYRVALYMRLSRDDEDYGESVSIETQRKIITQFANEQHFIIVDEYIDDGWTGTNFDRPAFQRMMEDVESGKVNCIITKDLSRLGREHIMMDYYLEFYFPEKRIRYIAVTENEDTEKGLSDFVPLRAVKSKLLSKQSLLLGIVFAHMLKSDISGIQKSKTALCQMKKQGGYLRKSSIWLIMVLELLKLQGL